MSIARKVAINTGVQILGQASNYGIGIITSILLVRYLGPAEFGKYAFVTIYIAMFGMINNFGMGTILARDIAKNKTKAGSLIENAILLKSFIALITMSLSIIIISLLRYPSDIRLYVYIISFTLILSAPSVVAAIFQVNLQMGYSSFCNLVGRLLFLGVVGYTVWSQGGISNLVVGSVVASGVITLMLLIFSRKFVTLNMKVNIPLSKHLFRESFPMGLLLIIGFYIHKVDILLLSRMDTNAAVGFYNAAYKFVDIGMSLPAILLISLLPLFSEYFSNSREKLIIVYQKSIDLLAITFIPIAIVVTIRARQIIELIYGPEYYPSTIALQILVWTVVLMSINIVFVNLLIAAGKQKKMITLYSVALVVNIILNLVGIPIFSYRVSAVASLICEVVVFYPLLRFTIQEISYKPSFLVALKSVAAAITTAGLLFLIPGLHVFIQLCLFLSTYMTILFILRGITYGDLLLFSSRRGSLQ